MTFINSSGTKKFKPAWQPVDATPSDVEEKENSATFDQDVNGKLNNNYDNDNSNEKCQKQEQASNENDR